MGPEFESPAGHQKKTPFGVSFFCRGNLLSVGSRVCQTPMSLRASAHTGVAIRNPCHCEARSGVAISCRLVPASIEIPCHCEPVRTTPWQSVLRWLGIENHRRKLRCFLCWHSLFSRPGHTIVIPSASVRGTLAGIFASFVSI